MPDEMFEKSFVDSWQVTFNSTCVIEPELPGISYSNHNQKPIIQSLLAHTIIVATLLTNTGATVPIYSMNHSAINIQSHLTGQYFRFKPLPNDNENDNETTYISERDINRDIDCKQVIEADTVRILSPNDFLEIPLTESSYNDILGIQEEIEVMAMAVEQEIDRLAERMNAIDTKYDAKIDRLSDKLDEIKDMVANVNQRLTTIETKVDITEKRTETWKLYILLPILTGIISGLVVYFLP